MRRARVAPRVAVELSDDEREALLRYQRRATVSQSLAARARIVMLCAQGHTDTEVAKIVAMGADTRGSHKSVEQLEDGYRRVPRRMERKPHAVQMD